MCDDDFVPFEDFQDELIDRFLKQRTNKYACNIYAGNLSFHNMSRKYFKCDNKDCDARSRSRTVFA